MATRPGAVTTGECDPLGSLRIVNIFIQLAVARSRGCAIHILVRRRGGQSRASETSETWKEWRRRRALDLHEAGWTQSLIAQALGVTEAAVSQWLKMVKESGPKALKPKSRQGQGARLSEEQLAKLPALLNRGPESFGFSGELWTCPRIAWVIEHELGVVY